MEALGDDHDESDDMRTSGPSLSSAATATPDERDAEHMAVNTKQADQASDVVEKEPTPPPLSHISPSRYDDVLIDALPVRDQAVKPTSVRPISPFLFLYVSRA